MIYLTKKQQRELFIDEFLRRLREASPGTRVYMRVGDVFRDASPARKNGGGKCADDWEERAKTIPAALERVIWKKVDKHYDPKPTLVVYLNVGFGCSREHNIANH